MSYAVIGVPSSSDAATSLYLFHDPHDNFAASWIRYVGQISGDEFWVDSNTITSTAGIC